METGAGKWLVEKHGRWKAGPLARIDNIRNASYIARMTNPTPVPTNSELEILNVLWRRGPSTVRTVHEQVGAKRDIGYTTVLKLMQLMAEKGLVERDESERSHVYAAAVPEKKIKKHLVSEMMDRVFEGSAASLVMQALSSKKASKEEIEQIRELLDRQSRGER
jgi:BlaI family transcriptional regulator, penicillinase repressor